MIRANRASKGNLGGFSMELNEWDQKVWDLMRHYYVGGVESPDPLPVKQVIFCSRI